MGAGAASQASNDRREQTQPDLSFSFNPDLVFNQSQLTSDVDFAEEFSLFPCDIRETLTNAIHLSERGFDDALVSMPNGRNWPAGWIVNWFGLDRYVNEAN